TGASTNTDEKDDVHKCSDAKPSVTVTRSLGSSNSYTISANVTGGTHPLNGNTDKGAGKLEFIAGDQVITSQDLSGPGLYTASYTPTSGGNQSVSARVIDSVLYEATSNPISLNVI